MLPFCLWYAIIYKRIGLAFYHLIFLTFKNCTDSCVILRYVRERKIFYVFIFFKWKFDAFYLYNSCILAQNKKKTNNLHIFRLCQTVLIYIYINFLFVNLGKTFCYWFYFITYFCVCLIFFFLFLFLILTIPFLCLLLFCIIFYLDSNVSTIFSFFISSIKF